MTLPPPYHPSSLSLTLDQRRVLEYQGFVAIGKFQKQGWSGPIEHYYFVCPVHGPVVDYRHHHRQSLHCVTCRKGEDE